MRGYAITQEPSKSLTQPNQLVSHWFHFKAIPLVNKIANVNRVFEIWALNNSKEQAILSVNLYTREESKFANYISIWIFVRI